MNNIIELAVFDMAGTTVDEQNVVYKTLHKAIENKGVELTLDTVLEFGAGKEKHQAIKDILVFLKIESLDTVDIFNDFKLMLDLAYQELEVKPIQGALETLTTLKERGIKIVLNTGYNKQVATNLLKKLNWQEGKIYDTLITASDVEKGRPHPEMIEKAMGLFEIKDASKVLKVGDSMIDIEEGKNANCGITIGVLSGAQTKEQISSAYPTYILDSIKEIPSLLKLNE
ncbi:phosphonatase-like hydrolase [Pseudofulvibacter geojedonensis]|uniref:Phosphonatase-like hydrolase n=1 Tax=Pseudofulvibacter geojedonensis TaxID=1123758 RepID=A0ABW3I133_9FLAO